MLEVGREGSTLWVWSSYTYRMLEVGMARGTWWVWSSHIDKMVEDGMARVTLRVWLSSIDRMLEVGRARGTSRVRVSCAGRILGAGVVRGVSREARRCPLGSILLENFSTSRSWLVVCEVTLLALRLLVISGDLCLLVETGEILELLEATVAAPCVLPASLAFFTSCRKNELFLASNIMLLGQLVCGTLADYC
jgi:hypothetical protein